MLELHVHLYRSAFIMGAQVGPLCALYFNTQSWGPRLVYFVVLIPIGNDKHANNII